MNTTFQTPELELLKPISKRRMLKLFKRYSAHPNREIHRHNIEQQDLLIRTISYANKHRAGLPAKESRQLVQNGINVMKEIIKGRFRDSHGKNGQAEFFQEWTKNCRGEAWFNYLKESRTP